MKKSTILNTTDLHSNFHFTGIADNQERKLRANLVKADLTDDAAIAVTCPIISKFAHRVIEKCFREAYGKTLFPDHWKRHSWFFLRGHSLLPGSPYLENNNRKTWFGL